MKAVILQSNYIPWRGYFDLIQSSDIFVFYDVVKYTKNDWRNRNRIKTSNGLQWVTIPVGSTAVKMRIDEVRLPNGEWRVDHMNKLRAAYSKGKFYHQLEELMGEHLFGDSSHLSQLNQRIIKSIVKRMGVSTTFVDAKDLNISGDRVQRLLNILSDVGATEYISGPAARGYLSGWEQVFHDGGIKLTFKEYLGYPEYDQLYSPFEPSVSIVDLVACAEWGQMRKYLCPTLPTTL